MGRENVPREGPVLVVANHMTNWDPPVLSLSLGRFVVFMGKEELFRYRLLNPFVAGLGIFPVSRGRMDRTALRSAERTLSEGLALAMFPEGSRSQDGRLGQAQPGSARIALRCRVPVLPAAITGTEKVVLGPRSRHRPDVTVSFGQPFMLEDECGSDRRRATDYMMERIAELLPPEYRGAYGDTVVG
jgi:1-acyl-sn-glycerol-3-phosphate acyltransferase